MTQGRISIANTTNIDTLLAARHTEDENSIQPPKVGTLLPTFVFREVENLIFFNVLNSISEKYSRQYFVQEQEQDKIAFIFNNLSMMNMAQKTEDLREVLMLEDNVHHSKWLAQVTTQEQQSL